jgi:hypothetical protein
MQAEYQPLTGEQLTAIKKDDVIERMLAFMIPVYLVVQAVSDDIIDAGWTFDRKTGLEVDEDLTHPASYIRRVLTEDEKLAVRAEAEKKTTMGHKI